MKMARLALALLCCPSAFAAANLVIASNVINANGQFVVTLNAGGSPCSSPLTPSSGVTGLTAYTQGFGTYTIASATTSGCTITITVNANATPTVPVFSDQGNQYLSIATGSNLTDASGNTISATGNTTVATTANNSTWYEMSGSTLGAHVQLDGSPVSGTSLNSSVQWASTDGCVRFIGSSSGTGGFNLLSFNYSSGFVVFQDGAQIGSQVTTTSDTGITTYPVGGSLTGTHTYEACENLTANGYYILYGLQLTGGMTFGSKPAAKKLMVVFGASETACQGINDSTTCVWWLLARSLGLSDLHVGQGGWPVTINTYGAAQYPTKNLRDCAKTPGGLCSGFWSLITTTPSPSILLFVPGGNDALDSTLIGTGYSIPGYFGSDAALEFGYLVSTLNAASAKIVVVDEYYAPGIGGSPCPASAVQQPYETAWQGAAAYFAAANPTYNVHAYSTFAATCGFGTGAFQSDQLHLNNTESPVTGQQQWANVLAPYLSTPGTAILIGALR